MTTTAKDKFNGRLPELVNVKMVDARRLTNSQYGNPRWVVTFTDGLTTLTYPTVANASCGYEVTNYAGKSTRLDVWLSKRGSVEYFREHDKFLGS